MGQRLDVRRMLLARGWTETRLCVLTKGDVLWASQNDCGDSGIDYCGPKRWSVEFNNDVPARIIVALAETAAKPPTA
jgi:hypothetical protein